MKNLLLVFFSLFFWSLKAEIRPRPEKAFFTTSVIIPCTHSHFFLLDELLEHLNNQEQLPDEVIISLSGISNLNPAFLQELKLKPRKFNLRLLEHSSRKSAGENRNLASDIAQGDILIYQDADDLPHPQRIQMIKSVFEEYAIDHLIHLWQGVEPFEQLSISRDELQQIKNKAQLFESTFRIHNGSLSILKQVYSKIHWDETWSPGEDLTYNERLIKSPAISALLTQPLIGYRPLSAFFRSKYSITFQDAHRIFGIRRRTSIMKKLKRCIYRYGNCSSFKAIQYKILNGIKSIVSKSDWEQVRHFLDKQCYTIVKHRLGEQFSKDELQKKVQHLSEFSMRFLLNLSSNNKSFLPKEVQRAIKSMDSKRPIDQLIDRVLFADSFKLKPLNVEQYTILCTQALNNFEKLLKIAQKRLKDSIEAFNSYKNLPELMKNKRIASHPSLFYYYQAFGEHLSILDSFNFLVNVETPYYLERVKYEIPRTNDLSKLESLLIEMRNKENFLRKAINLKIS